MTSQIGEDKGGFEELVLAKKPLRDCPHPQQEAEGVWEILWWPCKNNGKSLVKQTALVGRGASYTHRPVLPLSSHRSADPLCVF